jgi:HlyD family secretion protein
MRSMDVRTWAMRLALAVTIAVAAYFAWEKLKPQMLPRGIASANGRIEATEIDLATKIPGRIDRILADEGDFVSAGQVLVEMDTQTLRAQLRQAQADHRRAEINVDATRAQVVQRKAENEAALAGRAQRQAELDAAQRRFERSKQLVKRGTAAVETFDNDRARFEGAKAAVSAAEAQIAATHSAISAAASQAVAAEAAVDAAGSRIRDFGRLCSEGLTLAGSISTLQALET